MTNGNDTAFAPEWQTGTEGMSHYPLTKREYFAAMALQGILACQHNANYEHGDLFAVKAARQADLLIAALNKETK